MDAAIKEAGGVPLGKSRGRMLQAEKGIYKGPGTGFRCVDSGQGDRAEVKQAGSRPVAQRQVRWSGIPISFRIFCSFFVIHTVKGFGIVNRAERDVFLELSCFFHDPEDVGNLISGSSAFSRTSLNIWKFTVHIVLKPGLENFEHYFTSV